MADTSVLTSNDHHGHTKVAVVTLTYVDGAGAADLVLQAAGRAVLLHSWHVPNLISGDAQAVFTIEGTDGEVLARVRSSTAAAGAQGNDFVPPLRSNGLLVDLVSMNGASGAVVINIHYQVLFEGTPAV